MIFQDTSSKFLRLNSNFKFKLKQFFLYIVFSVWLNIVIVIQFNLSVCLYYMIYLDLLILFIKIILIILNWEHYF